MRRFSFFISFHISCLICMCLKQKKSNSLTSHLMTSDIPANDILELFGRMFFEFCQESGYDKILKILGATPRDFLQNLDALHDHLATIYPGMRAPSFRCTERDEDGALILHYYSERPGLEHIVIGIVKVCLHPLSSILITVHLMFFHRFPLSSITFWSPRLEYVAWGWRWWFRNPHSLFILHDDDHQSWC